MIDTDKDLSGLPDPQLDGQFYEGVPFKRAIAFVIDAAIILGVSMGFVIATFGLGLVLFPMFSLLFNLVYRIYLIGTRSATFGMRLAGIELRNNEGHRLDMKEAVWHTGLFTLLFMFFLTNFASIIMMLLNQRGQGLHDYLLGTTAINRPVD